MYKRQIEEKINQALKKYKIVSLLGPRQSGKTTLAKMIGSDFIYKNLEDISFRSQVIQDPKHFFESVKNNIILDEVQNFPEILSYLQLYTDKVDYKFKFIITGSNSLLLSNRISQSLAGRCRIFHILPLSYHELPKTLRPLTINEALYKGLYPRIYDQNLDVGEWISNYIQTYIQKDVRQLLNIINLLDFDKFLRIIAGRVGQLINYSTLAAEVGISVGTVKSWISVLEASFVVYQLQPHHKNFNKRITKARKLYFFDTAISCYLLRISRADHLDSHPLRGHLFENWVVNEKMKIFFNRGESPPLYFWRDQHGHEVDLVQDNGLKLFLSEIKISSTFNDHFLDQIHWLNALQNEKDGEVIYGGGESFIYKDMAITSWKSIK